MKKRPVNNIVLLKELERPALELRQ